ncbi:MAG: DNA replication/repair protein RecF [Caldilineae bacterium]|nr:MAG: DNA replication/repair protein RecF [Caldilineae bacterium]
MYLSHLSLTNYRNFTRLQTDFEPGPVLLQGNNAQGKTNLLESLYFLSTTTSPHARADRQLINWLALRREVLPFARLEGVVRRNGETLQIAITIVKEGERFKKDIRLNGVKKRAMDVIGVLNTVMFLPEDIELVTGSPSVRRRYLDSMLCQIDAEYCRALSQYNKITTQRNALLKELAENRRSLDQLDYWDDQLAQYGALLVVRRHNAVLELDAVARRRHRELTGQQEGLRLYYAPSFDPHDRPTPNYQMPLLTEDLGPRALPAPPLKQVIAAFKTRLQTIRGDEIARGVSLMGPHRDDLHFLVDGIDITLYGSRGQQRTAALSTKLAEVSLMQEATGETPLLLLDDVMSELDAGRRRQVLAMIDRAQQAFVTTTDWDDFDPAFRARAQRFAVREGRLEAVE